MKAKTLALVAVLVLALVPATSHGCAYYCSENGLAEDSCNPPSTLGQLLDSYYQCNVRERCVLGGAFCWTYCRVSGRCDETALNMDGSTVSGACEAQASLLNDVGQKTLTDIPV